MEPYISQQESPNVLPARDLITIGLTFRLLAGVNKWTPIPNRDWYKSGAVRPAEVVTPFPTTHGLLAVHAHECAHVHYQHDPRMPIQYCKNEREAWLWAFEKLAQQDLLTPKIEEMGRRFVAVALWANFLEYHPHAPAEVLEFIGDAPVAPVKKEELQDWSRYVLQPSMI